MSSEAKIKSVKQMLQPTGRAFRIVRDGSKDTLNTSLAEVEAMYYDDIASLMDSVFPDNATFSADDATAWERVFGLTTNTATPLATRKTAIQRKRSFPGKNPARAHYLYIQKQLQDAGFAVYVHENIPTQNPVDLNGTIVDNLQYGNFQYGGKRYGVYINHLVANSIYNANDLNFDIGQNFKCTFFIGGSVAGNYANVSAAREEEFRQLILRLKPAHMVAVLFINLV